MLTPLPPVRPIELTEIRAARERIASTIVRTPLVRLELGPEFPDIRLKLENLQPINAYKLRGAANAVARLPEAERARGVWTISAGNAGQGVAYAARQAGVPCTVVAIETAPAAKIDRMRSLGAKLLPVPYHVAWKRWKSAPFRVRPERSFTPSTMTISSPATAQWDWRFWKTRRTRRRSSRVSAGAVSLRAWAARSRHCDRRSRSGRRTGNGRSDVALSRCRVAAGIQGLEKFVRRRRRRSECLPADVGTNETARRWFLSR